MISYITQVNLQGFLMLPRPQNRINFKPFRESHFLCHIIYDNIKGIKNISNYFILVLVQQMHLGSVTPALEVSGKCKTKSWLRSVFQQRSLELQLPICTWSWHVWLLKQNHNSSSQCQIRGLWFPGVWMIMTLIKYILLLQPTHCHSPYVKWWIF